MKRIFFLLAIFAFHDAKSQNYLLSFAGTGASSTVKSVQVENLMKGTSLVLDGSDILHLTFVTGITPVVHAEYPELRIYPNPSLKSTYICLYPPAKGNAIITIFELTGKIVAEKNIYLENCQQELCISNLAKGLYLIIVKGNSYQYSGKLISNYPENGIVRIEKSGSVSAENKMGNSRVKKNSQVIVDMDYSIGDRLKFKGVSANFSTVITDIPSSDKVVEFIFMDCTDADNNHYPVVEIGTQIWMAENLKASKYRNGDLIGTTTPVTLNINEMSSPEYQWAFDGNELNADIYGRLYTWYAATDNRNICPIGWHLPSDDEWFLLADFLGGVNVASWKLKETGINHWPSPNSGVTNESGFTAIPGGQRNPIGTFDDLGSIAIWWSSTTNTYTWSRRVNANDNYVYRDGSGGSVGYSIRCVKD